MLTFFHPEQLLHYPRTYLSRGQMRTPQEVPERAQRLLQAASNLGFEIKQPADNGMTPIASIHDMGYLRFSRAHIVAGSGFRKIGATKSCRISMCGNRMRCAGFSPRRHVTSLTAVARSANRRGALHIGQPKARLRGPKHCWREARKLTRCAGHRTPYAPRWGGRILLPQ